MEKLSAYTDKNFEFLSHPIEEEKHNLIAHLVEVANYTQKLLSQTDFDIAKAGFYAGLLHDIGKLNPFYQELFLTKKEVREKEKELLLKYSDFHSPFSAWTGLKVYHEKMGMNYKTWLKIVSVIYGHHSKLRSKLPFKEDAGIDNTTKRALILNLKLFYQQIRDRNTTIFLNLNWDRCFRIVGDPISFQAVKLSTTNKINIDSTLAIKEFLEINILYSALLQADKGSFKEWKNPVFDISLDTSSLIKSESYLGDLRGLFQKEALENHDPTLDISILHAPTGIGKTKVFLNVLERYRQNRKLERVFYFSPLLALTEDFEKKITKTIRNIDDILVYNYLFSGTLLEKEDFKNEDKRNYNRGEWLFEYESFNKKFIITTTQRLLITLFSNKSSDKLKLLSLKNSILIIDEIQTIPKFIIPHLIGFLQQLSKYMKSKILLVSATIPFELSLLHEIKISDSVVESYLEKTQKNISFIGNLILPDISDGEKRILIMANTRKKTANIFNRIKCQQKKERDDNNKQKVLYYISRGIRKKDRIKIIDELTPSTKQQENYKVATDIIVVSTQLIEAGIDVSFSHIYREADPLR